MSKLDFAFTVKQLSARVKRGRGCQHVVRAHIAGEWFFSSDEHLFVQAFELHVHGTKSNVHDNVHDHR